MRAGFPNTVSTIVPVTSASYAAKSLSWKILEISPCDSRFCRRTSRSVAAISSGINILANGREKRTLSHRDQNVAKSLFWRILPASPFRSRFCGPVGLYQPRNFNEINILPARSEKNRDGRRPNRIEKELRSVDRETDIVTLFIRIPGPNGHSPTVGFAPVGSLFLF
jgi:hypothetical protein